HRSVGRCRRSVGGPADRALARSTARWGQDPRGPPGCLRPVPGALADRSRDRSSRVPDYAARVRAARGGAGALGRELTVVRLEIVQRKLAELDHRVARVRVHRRASRDELALDRDALDLVAFNVMLAVQAACDLAAHLIADEGWTAPASVAECFHQLAEHQVTS